MSFLHRRRSRDGGTPAVRSSVGPADPASENKLLDAAIRALVASPEASLDEIARRTSTDAAALRARFPTRDALIERIVMRGAHRIARGAFLEDGTPAEQIALLVGRLWDDQEPVAPFITMGVRTHLRVPVEQALAPARGLLADAVARGAKDGTLRADVAPRAVAWLIEQSMMDCLEALARELMEGEDGRVFAMRQALATAGLSWSDAATVAAAVEPRLS
ncbi:TetR/AcrR family transcriptional regulator [Demequina sp. SO4-13]|uniref:TetR/AcrR family transcriptional regulator n=1 Tax=Demequina sp. SO4-13 TaxID=3401027 RepID=UPI003AF8B616